MAPQPDICHLFVQNRQGIKKNPGSTFNTSTFKWYNSAAFDWHSRQLLDLGLMEPGQWFQYKAKFVDLISVQTMLETNQTGAFDRASYHVQGTVVMLALGVPHSVRHPQASEAKMPAALLWPRFPAPHEEYYS